MRSHEAQGSAGVGDGPSHPNATREAIIKHLEAAGFDENDWYPPHLRGVTWDKQLTDRGDMAQTQRKIHPALLQAAKTDPILSYMIRHGLPLNRKTWIEVNYGGNSEIPKPWTSEDEAEVPGPLRRQLYDD